MDQRDALLLQPFKDESGGKIPLNVVGRNDTEDIPRSLPTRSGLLARDLWVGRRRNEHRQAPAGVDAGGRDRAPRIVMPDDGDDPGVGHDEVGDMNSLGRIGTVIEGKDLEPEIEAFGGIGLLYRHLDRTAQALSLGS